jgi:hypothetical protein
MKYEAITDFSKDEMDSALEKGNLELLRLIPISVSLNSNELESAEQICLILSAHKDFTVRGNAILGFGHLARRFGKLTNENILTVIQNALMDENGYVCGQAEAAADDVEHFLKWKVSREYF